jgi:hypothetical protein
MALPDTAKIVYGTPLVWAHSGEYVPSDAVQPATIDADFDWNDLVAATPYQGAKLNLGSVNLDLEWMMKVYIEWHSAPTAGGSVDFYLGFSNDATAGEDNPGGLSGAEAAYQGYGGDAASGLEALHQLEFIGSLIVTADIALQVQEVGVFVPKGQYAMLVAVNNSSVDVAGTDAIETGVAITPFQFQIQD